MAHSLESWKACFGNESFRRASLVGSGLDQLTEQRKVIAAPLQRIVNEMKDCLVWMKRLHLVLSFLIWLHCGYNFRSSSTKNKNQHHQRARY